MATEGVKGLIICQLTRPIVRPWCMFDDSYDRMAERISAGGGWMNGSLGFYGILSTQIAAISCLKQFNIY